MRYSLSYRRVLLITFFASAAFFSPLTVLATWSIVAVDERTGEVGSAGATCTGFVEQIAGIAPGYGAIVAQARSNHQARRLGVQMLLAGASPEKVIQAVTDSRFDLHVQERQYGVVTLQRGESAAFTGADTHDWTGHVRAPGVAVQGNLLTGPEVIEKPLRDFESNEGLWLGERLLSALEEGSRVGGDLRCGEQDALSSYLIVARPHDPVDEPFLNLIVTEQPAGGRNPVTILRERFEEWRQHSLVDASAAGMR